MANVYDSQSISGYNSSPPADDGTETEANRGKYSTIKDKLADPVKTLAEAINTELEDAFDQVLFARLSNHSANYTVTTTDRGKLLVISGNRTLTLPGASSATSGFAFGFITDFANPVVFTPDGSDTINGTAGNTTVRAEAGFGILVSDGTSDWELMYRKEHPSFQVINSSERTDVTGDGTSYTVEFNSELSDRGSNFASNTFTAPTTGPYQFNVTVKYHDHTTSHTNANLRIVTSNRNYDYEWDPGENISANGTNSAHLSAIADMDSGDTAHIVFIVSGSTAVIDVNATDTYFGGFLIP